MEQVNWIPASLIEIVRPLGVKIAGVDWRNRIEIAASLWQLIGNGDKWARRWLLRALLLLQRRIVLPQPMGDPECLAGNLGRLH